jgi:hypothetical protein
MLTLAVSLVLFLALQRTNTAASKTSIEAEYTGSCGIT